MNKIGKIFLKIIIYFLGGVYTSLSKATNGNSNNKVQKKAIINETATCAIAIYNKVKFVA